MKKCNMKAKPILLMLGALWAAGLGANTASADEIMFDGAVSVPVEEGAPNGPRLRAYRHKDFCHTWYWVPTGMQPVSGAGVVHSVRPVRVRLDGGRHSTGYASQYSTRIAETPVSIRAMSALRAAIAMEVNNRRTSGGANARDWQHCPTMEAAQILLQEMPLMDVGANNRRLESDQRAEAQARRSGDEEILQQLAEVEGMPQLMISREGVARGAPIMINPTLGLDYNYSVDLTSPYSEPAFGERILTYGSRAGNITFAVSGAMPFVDASLTIRGSTIANYVTQRAQSACTVNESSTSGGGLILGFIGGVFGGRSRSVHCEPGPLQTFRAGGAVEDIEVSYQMEDRNFENITTEMCLDEACSEKKTVSYRNYIYAKLLELYITSNFQARVDAQSRLVLEPRGGENGQVSTSFNGTFKLRETRIQPVYFNVPVTIPAQPNIRFNEAAMNRPVILCARENYERAGDEHRIIRPVHPSCLGQ